MKKTLTIGAAALNEQANIVNSVQALLKQSGANFELKEIIIASDGSTDNTVGVLQEIGNPKIKILNFKERKGQLKRMADVIAAFDSDYLIFTDADIVFEDEHVAEKLVKALEEENVYMACGRAKPLEGRTFVEKAVRNTHLAYEDWAKKFKEGNNVFNVHGCIQAFRKDFIKKVNFPEGVTVADVFCYYSCISKGHKFKFVKNAAALIRVSSTISDQIKQASRYMSTSSNVDRFFNRELISKELSVPSKLKYISFLKMFLRNPLSCLFIFALNRYIAITVMKKKKSAPLWDLSCSTKKGLVQ